MGQINTKAARSALIDAFSNGASDVREHAAYALTWNPELDAEEVYIDFLKGHDEWHVRNAIKALGEIRSGKALPHLARIRDNPPGWHSYYTAIVALRKIESREFSSEIQAALDFLRQAKYSRDIDAQRLNDSANIIRQNFRATVADLFDIFLWVTKGNESTATPNVKTILHEAGRLAFPVVRIGLNDPDQNVSRKTKTLVEEFGWDEMVRENLQPDGAANGSQPFRSETNRTSSTADSQDEKRTKLWQSLRADWQFGKMEIQAYCENDRLDEVLLFCRGDGLLYRMQTHKFAVLRRKRELGPINEITFECGEHRRWRMWVSGELDYTLPCE